MMINTPIVGEPLVRELHTGERASERGNERGLCRKGAGVNRAKKHCRQIICCTNELSNVVLCTISTPYHVKVR